MIRTEYRNFETPTFPIEVVSGTQGLYLLIASRTAMDSSEQGPHNTDTAMDSIDTTAHEFNNFPHSKNHAQYQDAIINLYHSECGHGAMDSVANEKTSKAPKLEYEQVNNLLLSV